MKYVLYFLIGGSVVSAVTYCAGQSRTLLAAFFANLPVITLITFLTIYREAGEGAVVSYAKGLLIMLLPWLTYIFSVVLLTPRFGVIVALLSGLSSYLAASFLLLRRL